MQQTVLPRHNSLTESLAQKNRNMVLRFFCAKLTLLAGSTYYP
jgi:hypothetical protein